MNVYSLVKRIKGKRRIIKIEKLCLTIRRQLLEEDRDFPIAVVGPEGEGKSSFAEVVSEGIDENYTVERNTFFAPTAEQANNFFLNESKGSAPIFDEFGDIGYKLDFASSINKFLKKLFMKNRQSNMAPLLCIPNFLDIDRYYRWRIKLLVFIYKRGKFVIFKPLKYNILTGDNWQIGYNLKVWQAMTKNAAVNSPLKFLRTVRKWSIYYGEGSFKGMGKIQERKYKELKTAYYQDKSGTDFEGLKIKETRKTMMVKMFVCALKNYKVPLQMIADFFDLDKSTIAYYVKNELDRSKKDLFYKIFFTMSKNLLKEEPNNPVFTLVKKRKELIAAEKESIKKEKERVTTERTALEEQL